MFKSIKLASLGLGFCCLTLGLPGVSHAHQINVDQGKYGKNFDSSCKNLESCSFDKLELDIMKLMNELKDIKSDKGCTDDHKTVCKVDFGKDHCQPVCDDKGHDGCDVPSHCDPVCPPVCDPDPHAVPAPAASIMSGFGVFGVALLGWLKNRRSVRA